MTVGTLGFTFGTAKMELDGVSCADVLAVPNVTARQGHHLWELGESMAPRINAYFFLHRKMRVTFICAEPVLRINYVFQY